MIFMMHYSQVYIHPIIRDVFDFRYSHSFVEMCLRVDISRRNLKTGILMINGNSSRDLTDVSRKEESVLFLLLHYKLQSYQRTILPVLVMNSCHEIGKVLFANI